MRFALLLALLSAAAGAQSPPVRVILRPLSVPATDTSNHIDIGKDKAHAVVVVAYDANSQLLTNQRVVWTISDTNIARISGSSASGMIHAKNYGSTFVTANIQGRTATLPVCVYDAKFLGGVVVHGPSFIALGLSGQYTATTTNGTPFLTQCIHWSTNSPSITVDRMGVVYGYGATTSSLVTAFLGTP